MGGNSGKFLGNLIKSLILLAFCLSQSHLLRVRAYINPSQNRDSTQSKKNQQKPKAQWIEEPTLLVTRFEYANLFHTVTDWCSAYVSSRVTGLPNRPHLVFVDGHCTAPLEETWNALYSGLTYAKNFTGSVCFCHAVLSPLQDASVIVGAHGAGMTRIVSATPKTIILEIISSFFRRPHFRLIAQWKGLEYHAINLARSYANPPVVVEKLNDIMRRLGCLVYMVHDSELLTLDAIDVSYFH